MASSEEEVGIGRRRMWRWGRGRNNGGDECSEEEGEDRSALGRVRGKGGRRGALDSIARFRRESCCGGSDLHLSGAWSGLRRAIGGGIWGGEGCCSLSCREWKNEREGAPVKEGGGEGFSRPFLPGFSPPRPGMVSIWQGEGRDRRKGLGSKMRGMPLKVMSWSSQQQAGSSPVPAGEGEEGVFTRGLPSGLKILRRFLSCGGKGMTEPRDNFPLPFP